MSGTINALDNEIGVIGVFPSVPMHIVRVFGDDGNWAYSSELINAVDDCVSNGARVINMSLGGPRPSVLENAVFLHAQKNGVLSIAAAGNGGDGRACDIFADPGHPERQACKMHYPSGYDSVVSVAAVDETADIADFSQVNSKVEIAAPGVSVLSTVPTGSMIGCDTDERSIVTTRSCRWITSTLRLPRLRETCEIADWRNRRGLRRCNRQDVPDRARR